MYAPVVSRLQNDFSSYNPTGNAIAARTIGHKDYEIASQEVDTWDSYLDSLNGAIFEAKAARRTAQRDYEQVQAEAGAWERQLQVAMNCDEDLSRQALLSKTACRDRASRLKVLIDRHNIQISTLASQLAFWENRLA